MLPRKNRISSEHFPAVTRGKTLTGSSFRVVFVQDKTLSYPRCAVIVSKKIAKTAVERNALRRKTYEILGEVLEKLPAGFISVLFTKKDEFDGAELKKLLLCLKI